MSSRSRADIPKHKDNRLSTLATEMNREKSANKVISKLEKLERLLQSGDIKFQNQTSILMYGNENADAIDVLLVK